MASFRKRGSTWTATVRRQGISKSRSFPVKAQAQSWATQIEAEIIAGKNGHVPDKTFGELLTRYAEEVSIHKRGKRWEVMRINLLCRNDVAKVKLANLDQKVLAGWRDGRMREVSAASVSREMNLISHALNVATREWMWLTANPIKGVRRPPPTRPRDRRPSGDEIERIIFALGYSTGNEPAMPSAKVGAACLFAIETAMRCGEICDLTWQHVHLDKRYVHIKMSKNGLSRDVPLSSEAVRVIKQLPRYGSDGEDRVFRLNTSQVDVLFRKAKGKALVDDLHFHDFRHEAITRLARKLDVLDLARMVGHRDLRQLSVYYNATAEEMATRLG